MQFKENNNFAELSLVIYSYSFKITIIGETLSAKSNIEVKIIKRKCEKVTRSSSICQKKYIYQEHLIDFHIFL